MDKYFKLVLIIFLSLIVTSTSYAQPWDINGRFTARNLAALRKAELSTMLAATASVEYQATTTSGAKVFARRTVPVTKVAFGGMLKKLAFSPWGFAIVAALEVADYVLDDNTQEITGTSTPDTSQGFCYGGIYFSAVPSTLSGCQSMGNAIYGNGQFHSISPSAIKYYVPPSNFVRYWWVGPSGVDYQAVHDTTVASPITDTELSDFFIPNMSDGMIKDVLTSPTTGLPSSNTTPNPPVQDASTPDTDPFSHAADQATNDYNANPNVDPSTTSADDEFSTVPGNPTITVEVEDPCDENPDRVGCSTYGVAA